MLSIGGGGGGGQDCRWLRHGPAGVFGLTPVLPRINKLLTLLCLSFLICKTMRVCVVVLPWEWQQTFFIK